MVWAHDVNPVGLADLPAFGRAVRLVWNKRRWRCPSGSCAVRTFTEQQPRIAPPRARMTARAARHATRRAGAGRAISEIAAELGAGWHTVMRAVHRWGRALLEADSSRIDGVTALGLDEILMFRRGRYRQKHWGTTVVDARRGILLDIVAGRSAAGATRWIQGRTLRWRGRVRWAVMGPVWALSQGVQHGAGGCGPGRGPVPCGQARRRSRRRRAPTRPERHDRRARHQGRPAVSDTAAAAHSRRADHRPRPSQAARPARCRGPPRRGPSTHGMPKRPCG